MRIPRIPTFAAAAVLLVLAAAGARAGEEEKEKGVLKVRLTVEKMPAVYTPSYALRKYPGFSFANGEGTISLGEVGSYKVWARDRQIVIDKNKDGKPGGDAVVVNCLPTPTAPIGLHVGTIDGREAFYFFRFTAYDARKKTLRYACVSALTGLVGGQRFWFLDEDGNGRYGDAGTDVLYLQGTSMAAPLGNIALINGKFYNLELDEKALRLTLRPADVKYGAARLTAPSGVWPFGAVVEGGGGYFALGPKNPVLLPEGNYKVHFALLANQAWTCTMLPKSGNMGFSVAAGKHAAFSIKGVSTVKVDATVKRNGKELEIKPPGLPLVGKSGETYEHWTLKLPPPRIVISVEERDSRGRGRNKWKQVRRVNMIPRRNGGFENYTWDLTKKPISEGRVQVEIQWRTPLAGTAKGTAVFTVKRGKFQ